MTFRKVLEMMKVGLNKGISNSHGVNWEIDLPSQAQIKRMDRNEWSCYEPFTLYCKQLH